jgi:hypothetical protein
VSYDERAVKLRTRKAGAIPVTTVNATHLQKLPGEQGG